MSIYIIGHKSPDLDSVAAAISYARYKNSIEQTDRYLPAVTGEINPETKFVLDKYGLEAPEKIDNAAGKEVILVDHNEMLQAADGTAEAKVTEILDHHKVDFKNAEPIHITVRPWGASCTIIADLFLKNNIEIEADIASIMLAAILVDTVITKSPTCTDKDKQIIEALSEKAGISDWRSFGFDIFKIRASVYKLSAPEIIKSDFKDFNFKQGKFGIGQVETVDLQEFKAKEAAIIDELENTKASGNYHSVLLFITDIINEGSKVLAVSDEQAKLGEALGGQFENNAAYIPGIVSRKKQVVPKINEVFDK